MLVGVSVNVWNAKRHFLERGYQAARSDLGCLMSTNPKSKSYSRRSAGILLLVGVLAGVTVGGGVGVIAASSTKSVTVCANKKTNVLRYAKNGKCVKTETKVVLNQTGADGISGAVGAKGDSGAAGVAGAKGDSGAAGVAGAKGDTGAAGTNGTNGTNGTLAITQQSVCDGSDTDTIANEVCKVGMTGPGGGLIFFVDYNDEYATYDYLEVAPADAVYALSASTGVWATTATKCGPAPRTTDCQAGSIYTETGVALATIKGLHRGLFGGRAGTAAIVDRMNTGIPTAKNTYAAGVADDYVSPNGTGDWWLPSKDELQKMQENLNNKGVGGFASDFYWSSSEVGAYYAWLQAFDFGYQYNLDKSTTFYVRPVRAF